MKLDLQFEQNSQNINVSFAESGGEFNTNFGETSVLHDGQNGATFIPSVSSDGVISWTNDRELPNPDPVNIKGEKGEKGEQGERGLQGIQGIQGERGKDGEKGDKGDKGDEGDKGEKGDKGDKGEPGISPHIGDNGNWFIGDVDTGVSASGGGNVEFTSIDPSMIIFPNGVKTTYPIGKVELVNGIGELISVGGNLNEFFEKFIDETPPNTIQPSVSLTFSQAKGYEVGTKVTPSYSASFNKGSYTYDDDTGVSVSAWSVKDTNNKILTTATGSFPELTVSDGLSYKITATATHSAGIVPKTNTGKDYVEGQIKEGAKSATSGALTGYRNTFYGTLTTKIDPTSEIIRGLTTKSGKALANGNSFTISIPVGALRVMFAYPATLRDVTSVKDVNGMNAEIKSSFVKITVLVEGANGYNAIEYKVYILDFAEPNGTANKFTVQI